MEVFITYKRVSTKIRVKRKKSNAYTSPIGTRGSHPAPKGKYVSVALIYGPSAPRKQSATNVLLYYSQSRFVSIIVQKDFPARPISSQIMLNPQSKLQLLLPGILRHTAVLAVKIFLLHVLVLAALVA